MIRKFLSASGELGDPAEQRILVNAIFTLYFWCLSHVFVLWIVLTAFAVCLRDAETILVFDQTFENGTCAVMTGFSSIASSQTHFRFLLRTECCFLETWSGEVWTGDLLKGTKSSEQCWELAEKALADTQEYESCKQNDMDVDVDVSKEEYDPCTLAMNLMLSRCWARAAITVVFTTSTL